MVKRIGILTSGGDCAGLNAAIRAATYRAIQEYGWRVFGIHKGTTGLILRPLEYEELTIEQCDSSMLRAGGTMLGSTNRENPFNFPIGDAFLDRSETFYEGYNELKLDALIGIGGDGSMKVLRKLAQIGGLNLVTIPKTIDNDVGCTDSAIGYSTAVEVVTEALDRLQPTAASHQRVIVLEVMGRDAGHIALASGIAGGADVILVPEIRYCLDAVCKKITSLAGFGRKFAIVIVSEAVAKEDGQPVTIPDSTGRLRYGGIGHYLGERINKITGAETRVTVLGHVQRGGQPSARDRLIASALGIHAVDLINAGKFDHMTTWKNRAVSEVPIQDAIDKYQNVDINSFMVRTARGLGICLGDE